MLKRACCMIDACVRVCDELEKRSRQVNLVLSKTSLSMLYCTACCCCLHGCHWLLLLLSVLIIPVSCTYTDKQIPISRVCSSRSSSSSSSCESNQVGRANRRPSSCRRRRLGLTSAARSRYIQQPCHVTTMLDSISISFSSNANKMTIVRSQEECNE